MRIVIGLLMLAGLPAFAADADFNGRWDIKADNSNRAWWVELNGVGTPAANGKFVSAFGGDMNNIDTISVSGGELKFVINAPQRNGKSGGGSFVCKARLVGGKLEGTQETEGANRPPVKWVGVRAPEIKDKDDGSWKKGKPLSIFNGKDLTGWKASNPNAEMKWSVVEGILKNAPPTTDILTEQKFWNFELHMEFRIVARSNSGVALRGRYEIQILDDFGSPPNSHGAAALYSRIAPSVNASKKAGEWQTYDIRLVGRTLTVVHNGTKVLDKVQVDGLTAMANNSDEAEPGPFLIQGDHTNVEIKSFVVTPLTK